MTDRQGGADAHEGPRGIRRWTEPEKAAAMDPAPKTARPRRKNFLRPKRSARLPLTSKRPAKTMHRSRRSTAAGWRWRAALAPGWAGTLRIVLSTLMIKAAAHSTANAAQRWYSLPQRRAHAACRRLPARGDNFAQLGTPGVIFSSAEVFTWGRKTTVSTAPTTRYRRTRAGPCPCVHEGGVDGSEHDASGSFRHRHPAENALARRRRRRRQPRQVETAKVTGAEDAAEDGDAERAPVLLTPAARRNRRRFFPPIVRPMRRHGRGHGDAVLSRHHHPRRHEQAARTDAGQGADEQPAASKTKRRRRHLGANHSGHRAAGRAPIMSPATRGKRRTPEPMALVPSTPGSTGAW